jgi:uncharacterized protein (TIGR00661 family)
MAKILYGVAGEGFGHSSRSELLGQRLIEAGHDVIFAASGKSLRYLSPAFGKQVKQVHGHGLTFCCQDGRVLPGRTVLHNLQQYRKGFRVNRELFSTTVKDFKPDVVISDFEPYSAWWAWRHHVPCVSIDHEHLLTCCDFDKERASRNERWMAKFVTRGYHTFADAYVIPNFFDVPINNRNAVLTPPVVRNKVLEYNASDGDHILMYSTDSGTQMQKRVYDIASRFTDFRFHIYGFNQDLEKGNCIFKETSSDGFLQDLSACRAVIATAGFSLISECLHFRKPMLLMPIQDQYEQMLNALYVEKLGAGHRTNGINADSLSRFLNSLDRFSVNHPQLRVPDNHKYFEILDLTFEKIGIPLNLTGSVTVHTKRTPHSTFRPGLPQLLGG